MPPTSHYSPAPPTAVRALPMTASRPVQLPDRYRGSLSWCKGFLFQCSLYFAHYPALTEQIKVASSSGRVLEWATEISSFDRFIAYFRFMFDQPPKGVKWGNSYPRSPREKPNGRLHLGLLHHGCRQWVEGVGFPDSLLGD